MLLAMGAVRKVLAEKHLPDLLPHNSRLFVDLCENVHIHYREFRTVFSVEEFFEYASIVAASAQDLRNYLENNPDYKEGVFRDTIAICGGREQQYALLRNSPAPNEPKYFANWFAIELQEESVIDEVQVHWRNYRFAFPREHLRIVAEAFTEAIQELDGFERDFGYEQAFHPHRSVASSPDESPSLLDFPHGFRTRSVSLSEITLNTDFESDPPSASSPRVASLIELIRHGRPVAPIIISSEPDGSFRVVDGHHRVLAQRLCGFNDIEAVVLPMPWKDTAHLREAEIALKRFDEQTNQTYGMTNFLKSYLAMKFDTYYRDDFRYRIVGTPLRRALRKLRRSLARVPIFRRLAITLRQVKRNAVSHH